ncbi:MAG: carboxypeptidase-like regulatory domain-containing protein, partial [Rhodothermales bacterium]
MIRKDSWRGAILIASFLLIASTTASAQKGSIAGTVVDAGSGESLIGANVIVGGTSVGSTTDLDGYYVIKGVEPGTYDVVFSYIGYHSKTVQNVSVSAGETTTIDLSLAPETLQMEDVIIEARALQNTEAILLRQRQKAAAVSDAISAEAISRSGSSTAADAMKKVTGASVVDGKYVFVRGLGERYINTQLNGAELPSADPDRNSIPLDLFPANLLENVVTSKTFTPDQPGNFSGGSINIGTRSYPESFSLQFSTSISSSSNVGPGGDFLSYSGGEA